ncbi:MAG: FAD-binding oxidoreductase [Alphaproteobacteria bacterium]|nr:FAD-binding oxidoreductase [Alphaproteobacteria bacterium]
MDLLTINDRPGEYSASYYAATAQHLSEFPTATGEISCDVCVIGGGYTGLSTALHLAERGFDVALLDAHRVGWGASGRNGGQVGVGQRVDQDALEKMVGANKARALWDLSLASMSLVKHLISKHKIDCGFTAGIIEADHRKRDVVASHDYVERLQNAYGYKDIRALDQDEMRRLVGSDGYFGGSLDMGSGHLHPLNYALGLARAAREAGVRIFENSRVITISAGSKPLVRTECAQIKADFVALGCNGYLGGLEKTLGRKMMPINNYIVATEQLDVATAENLIRKNHAVADSRFVINYFRLSKDRRMLFGGGESYGYRFPSDIKKLVLKPMLKVYPQLKDVKIDYAWGGTLGITMSRMPVFERVSVNILSAGGFSGHGVAMATLAGEIMAETIAGTAARFDLMASVPTPSFPGGVRLRWPLLVLAMTWYSLRDRF